MIKSLCRGLNRIASAPNRARSYRLDAVAISSIPQQAVANGIGHSELLRAQFTTFLRFVVRKLSGSVCVSMYSIHRQTTWIIIVQWPRRGQPSRQSPIGLPGMAITWQGLSHIPGSDQASHADHIHISYI